MGLTFLWFSVVAWSANTITISNGGSYDFTTGAGKAYGSNQIDVYSEGIWSFYSGDINQDQFIDANDYPFFDYDNFNAVAFVYLDSFGVDSDINGDGFTDANDYPIFDNNNFKAVMSIHP